MITFTLFGYRIALGKNPNQVSAWACYYGDKDRTAQLTGFDLLISDPRGQNPDPLRAGGVKVLVYVSLGEITENSPYYGEAKKLGLLVRHNKNWNSWVVDVRRPEWQALLLNHIIPDALSNGYDGLFFDTLDSPIDMQRRDPDKYKGTERSCVELVKDIRKKYPELLLCQNRGFEIIRRTAPYLDYLLIEGLSSNMHLSSGVRSDVSDSDREFLIAKAFVAIEKNPKLVVLSLDYSPIDDVDAINRAYDFSRKQGFVPYVSTPDLNEVYVHEINP